MIIEIFTKMCVNFINFLKNVSIFIIKENTIGKTLNCLLCSLKCFKLIHHIVFMIQDNCSQNLLQTNQSYLKFIFMKTKNYVIILKKIDYIENKNLNN